MKKSLLLFIALSLGVGSHLLAQQEVRFGQYSVVPEQNVARARGAAKNALAAIAPTRGKVNVLMQFREVPDAKLQRELARAGVVLEGYVGGNAYFAQVEAGSRPSDFARHGATSVIGVRPEWKVSRLLSPGRVPRWADRGNGRAAVTVSWFSNADASLVRGYFASRGFNVAAFSRELAMAEVEMPLAEVMGVAAQPWVQHVGVSAPPSDFLNYDARALSAGTYAVGDLAHGGRGLTGKGVRVGLWDANVEQHVDYGSRVHVQEFEIPVATTGAHGMHTCGTIAGAGFLNTKARGFAPGAEVYASNFNRQSNGLSVAEEMLKIRAQYNIALTSNSYGAQLGNMCDFYDQLTYTVTGAMLTDYVSTVFPTLSHFYSAGNSQGDCDREYGSNTARAKNVIYVGATDRWGYISDFSSFGPMDDGRLLPTVTAKGVSVLSTINSNGYKRDDGTSMSCPAAAGMATLLTERYHQLHGGQHASSALVKGLLANTADDRGNAGPDYQYGYGVVNLEAALTSLEKGWYAEGVVKSGAPSQSHTLRVPAGVKQMRVMLTWIDPVVAKEFAYGEPALVNDLDLTVDVAGTTRLPWVLDKDHPEKEAKPGIDALNNIEQVTIDAPAVGEVVVRIGGHDKIRQGGEQRYALTWFFDFGEPQLLHPIGGESFSPNEIVLVRVDNLEESVNIELSYDGGKSYPYSTSRSVVYGFGLRIPKDAPMTARACLRLTDAKGRVVVSPGYFTIAPEPQKLECTARPCDLSSWTLTWEEVKGAKKYVVLQADVPRSTWKEIGVAEGTQFEVPQEKVARGERNIFAVAVQLEDGKHGPQSEGVLVGEAVPMELTAAQLPLEETFVRDPLPYAKLDVGEKMKVSWEEASRSRGYALGSRTLVVDAIGTSAKPPFGVDSSIFSLRYCDLDLTQIATDTKLVFYSLNEMPPYDTPEDTQMRLQVDGQAVKNVLGSEAYLGKREVREMLWNISDYVGQKIRLELQFSSTRRHGGMKMFACGIRKVSEKPDVGITLVQEKAPAARMGFEDITLAVQSKSLAPVAEVPLVVFVDGEVRAKQIVEGLKPFEKRVVKVPVDFSTADKNGHIYTVRIAIDPQGDATASDNELLTEVYNMGDIFALPPAETHEFMGQKVPREVHTIKKVDKPFIFTDDGGVLRGYGEDHLSSVKFRPASPNKVVCIAFRYCRLNGSDELNVYAAGLKKDFEYRGETPAYTCTSSTSNQAVTIVSQASDGSLTVTFESRFFEQGDEGWVAEVSQVERENSLTLLPLAVEVSKAEKKATITLKVKNHLPAAYYDLPGVLKVGSRRFDFTIPELPANGEAEYKIPSEFAAPYPTYKKVEARLYGYDADGADNVQTAELWNDRFWKGGKIKEASKQGFAEISVDTAVVEVVGNKDRQDYNLTQKLPLYNGSMNQMLVSLADDPTAEDLPASLHVWLDLDSVDDGFKDDAVEHYTLPLVEDQADYVLPIDFSAANPAIGAGTYRMRIAVLPDNAKESFVQGEDIAWGRSTDVLAEVHEGKNSHADDLEIRFTDDGGYIYSGSNLSAAQPVSVEVINHGYAPVKDVSIELSLDGAVVATETVSDEIPAHGGLAGHTFNQTVDLSKVGSHKVSVKLPDDGIMKNNVAEQEVECVRGQATDKFYTLSFMGDESESVVMPGLGTGKRRTIEGWFKIDRNRHSILFESTGLSVAYTYNMAGGLPDNGIGIVVGQGMIRWTKPNVLMPGEFHHLALTLEVERSMFMRETELHLYIDGEEVPLEGRGMDGATYGDFRIASRLYGDVKMFRMWSKILDADEIKENMNKSVRESSGKLPDRCWYEFMMNEGAGASMASGGLGVAKIESARVDSEKNNVWEALKLISGVEFEGQLLPSRYGRDGAITFIMPAGQTKFTDLTGKINTVWPGTKLTYNGAPVTSDTKFDFSAADHTITLSAECDALGMKVEQKEVKVKLLVDKNSEAKITELSLLTADNANLKADVKVENPDQTVVLTAEDKSDAERLDLSKLQVTFAGLSAGATVLYKGKEITQGAKLELDLTSPVVVMVLAENQRDHNYYTLQMEKAQSIAWDTTPLTLAFTNVPVSAAASSSSGRSVVYRSDDPNVAMLDADGNLHTVGVGKTRLVAMVPAGGGYTQAAPVEREVTITPAALRVAPKPQTMKEGGAWPNTILVYDGMLFNESPRQFRQPEYEVYKDPTTVWAPAMGPLSEGEYTLKAKGYDKPYADGNYEVTLADGVLTVSASEASQDVTFTVRDGGGAVLEGAAIAINSVQIVTSKAGEASIRLLPGVYSYSVVKEGYELVRGEIEVAREAVAESVALRKFELTLSYGVDPSSNHGVIFGPAGQRLVKGGDGVEVVAVPADGYRFEKWSDGEQGAVRRDVNVQESKTLAASFVRNSYTIVYRVSEGGELESGVAKQTVEAGQNGSEVVVKANPGYVFLGWSDGLRAQKRQDKALSGNIDVEAQFYRPLALPMVEDFDNAKGLPQFWSVDNYSQDNGSPWTIGQTDKIALGRGQYAMVDSDGDKRDKHQNTTLFTPWFDLSGVTQDVFIEFDILFKGIEKRDSARLEYRCDDGEWALLKQYDDNTYEDGAHEEVTLEADKLRGKQHLQLRWTYASFWTFWVAVDNIEVKTQDAGEVIEYFAGPNGKLTSSSTASPTDHIVQSLRGNPRGEKVTAVADAGYAFDYWSDGVLTPEREDAQSGRFTAHFKYVPTETFEVIYTADGLGRIEGPAYQEVGKGENAKSVAAVGRDPRVRFDRWSDGKQENPRVEENVTQKVEAKAMFVSRYQLSLSVANPQGGTVSAVVGGEPLSRDGFVDPDATVTISAQPRPGYYVAGWEGVAPSSANALTVQLEMKADAKVSVKFERFVGTLTFSIVAVGSNIPQEDVTVSLDNGQTRRTNAEGKAVFEGLTYGQYNYSVALPGEQGISSAVEVMVESVEEKLEMEWGAAATFIVSDEKGTPLVNAIVAIGDQKVRTDAHGVALLKGLAKQVCAYTVTLDGYATESGKIDLTTGGSELKVALKRPTATLTFVVSDERGPISGAKVTLQGVSGEQITDAKGEAKFEGLALKAYEYAVSHEGYASKKGVVELRARGVTLPVKLEKATPVEAEELLFVALSPNPASAFIQVESAARVEKMSIVSPRGVVLMQHENVSGASTVVLAIDNLPEGAYLLVVESAGKRRALPFAVQR